MCAVATETRLATNAPYDGEAVLRWLGARLVPGVEALDNGVYRRTLRLAGGPAIVAIALDGGAGVRAELRLADPADQPAAVRACRALLDLDACPEAHNAVLRTDPALGPLVAARPGLRAPGTVDPAETAVRAVLGQQVSLAAARTLAGRVVALCGDALAERDGALTHAFPAPGAIAAAPLERIGMPAARRRTLRAVCGALAMGELDLGDRAALLALPGIGPWTADYIALRALGDPDAFPAGDLGLRRGAEALALPTDAAALEARAERWRPWRRYAAHHLWAAA